MIKIEHLSFSVDSGAYCNPLDLTVEDGEFFCLMCKYGTYVTALFRMLQGVRRIQHGRISVDDQPVEPGAGLPLAQVDRIVDPVDYESEITLWDFIEYFTRRNKVLIARVLETLLVFNLFEKNLRKKVKQAEPADFKAVCLALLLADEHPNIVVFDFVRGEGKDFELNFNRLMREKIKEGKALLYLTSDLFYAYQVADRVSFIKNGYMVPERPILYEDLKEMDVMKLYKQYMS